MGIGQMKTIQHLSLKDARRLMGKWIDQEYCDDHYDNPYKLIGQFLDWAYEHSFEVVIEGTLWNSIFPKSRL